MSVANSSSTTGFTYSSSDALGRPATSTQTTAGTAFPFTYTYYPIGLNAVTYPSGRQVSYQYDTAGRILSVSGAKTYASLYKYASFGGVQSLQYGNNQYEQTCYNKRLQATGIRVGASLNANRSCTFSDNPSDLINLAFSFTTGANNGNLTGQSINPGAYAQTYSYTDGLNRLNGFGENSSAINQSYAYDAYGNRGATGNYIPAGGTRTPGSTSGYANNQWTNFSYDAAGNVIFDQMSHAGFDAENRMTSSTGNATVSYVYDGEGKRVQKNASDGNTTYVYDASGQLAAEYATVPPPTPCTPCWLTADHLGSTRLLTDSGGTVRRRYDYLPFGEEIPQGIDGRGAPYEAPSQLGSPDAPDNKFTSKERDAETGLDWFEARYMSAAQGRFTSPDPATGSQRDPQSWNMYSYARNNPLLYTDPDGQTYRICDTSGHCDDSYSDANFDKNLAGTANNGTIYDSNGNTIGTYQRTSFDDLGPLGNSLYQGMAARRQASKQIIGVFAGGSLLGGAGVAGGLAVSGAGLTTLGLQAAAVAAPLLPAVPSAIEKLQKIGLTLQQANAIVQNPATQKLIDNANNGNINCLQQVGDKVVRITTDPTGQRIISAGYVRANSIVNGIANGRFTAK